MDIDWMDSCCCDGVQKGGMKRDSIFSSSATPPGLRSAVYTYNNDSKSNYTSVWVCGRYKAHTTASQ